MNSALRWALPALAVLAAACLPVLGYEDARPGWTGSSTSTSTSGSTGGTGGTISSSSSSGGTGGTGGMEPTCTDDVKNGNETDKDCGGGTCPPCGLGKGCVVGPDCDSNVCSGGTCVPPGCDDQIKNGTETDIDCGGGTCAGCANGKACVVDGDCASANCVGNNCEPASCKGGGPGLSNCGPIANESCCSSLPVPAGTFYLSYDGVTFPDKTALATVNAFQLDKYEVTVGRFRRFVAAWDGGWRPAAAAGKHTHLNGGGGLNAGTEPGWDATWTSTFATTATAWGDAAHLGCSGGPTWTPTVGANDSRPINCITSYEAYAFCIWDGGFLPSEAEWNYVAAGGSDQRVYPWSTPPRQWAYKHRGRTS